MTNPTPNSKIFTDMLKDINVPKNENNHMILNAIELLRTAIESGKGFVLATEVGHQTQSLAVNGLTAPDLANVMTNIARQCKEAEMIYMLHTAADTMKKRGGGFDDLMRDIFG